MTDLKKIKEDTLKLLKTSDPAKVSYITEAYLKSDFQELMAASQQGDVVFGHSLLHDTVMGKYLFRSDYNGALGCDESPWSLPDSAYNVSNTGRLCIAFGAYEIYQFTRR